MKQSLLALLVIGIFISCNSKQSMPSFKGRKTEQVMIQIPIVRGVFQQPRMATKIVLDTVLKRYDTNVNSSRKFYYDKIVDSGYEVFYKGDTFRDNLNRPIYDSLAKKFRTYRDTVVFYNWAQVMEVPERFWKVDTAKH